jgi:hypothetical protein
MIERSVAHLKREAIDTAVLFAHIENGVQLIIGEIVVGRLFLTFYTI